MDTNQTLWVSLDEGEVKRAVASGMKRQRMHRQIGRPDGKVVADGIDIDISGCLAEFAVAKAFGMPWDGEYLDNEKWSQWRTDGHDVSGIEVRSTRHHDGRLLLHKRDKDDSPYVLVRTHAKPRFQIVGWMLGRDGKKPEFWTDVGYGRPCYLVPTPLLRPPADLVSAVTLKR